MCNLQQQENSYRNSTSLNCIGPQTTSDAPQKRQFCNRRICKLGHETKTFKNMGYEMALDERKVSAKQLRVYWDRGTNNDADYLTKHTLT